MTQILPIPKIIFGVSRTLNIQYSIAYSLPMLSWLKVIGTDYNYTISISVAQMYM